MDVTITPNHILYRTKIMKTGKAGNNSLTGEWIIVRQLVPLTWPSLILGSKSIEREVGGVWSRSKLWVSTHIVMPVLLYYQKQYKKKAGSYMLYTAMSVVVTPQRQK